MVPASARARCIHHEVTKRPVVEFEIQSRRLIGAAIEVHRALGPGLLESAYVRCLEWELRSIGLEVEREVVVPLWFRGHQIDAAYRIDLLVDGAIIVEVKCVKQVERIHRAQLLTYLKLTGLHTGFIFNFKSLSSATA
jgi:GxxExxY protein